MWCIGGDPQNCGVSEAVRDIFPDAITSSWDISPFNTSLRINLPIEARMFIHAFDRAMPNERLMMPELEFEVSIPDSVIEKINIDEIKPLLVNHPSLKLSMIEV